MAESGNSIDDIPFYYFCQLCDKIKTQKISQKKAEILLKFIDNVMKSNPTSFFPILRLLLPQLDRERGPYGMKEANLARTYIKILSLAPNSFEAKRLINFSAPCPTMTSGAMGDFAEVVCCILRTRCGEGKKMTVGEVNNALDRIANKHAAVVDELTNMMQIMSNNEQKWLIRIIIKEMSLGLGEKRILNLYHPDAMEVYTLTNSIFQVCTKLKNRSIRHQELEIELFRAFRPMLCERGDVHNLSVTVPHYVEPKFDGERFQLHYKDGQFKYFSRNGYEYSDNYGADPESGYFTSLIMKQWDTSLTSCVLDGEMMGWHRARNKLVNKAHNIDVKNLRVGSTLQPCFCVFDVLMYNDQVVTKQPLCERINMLEKIFTPLDGVIMRVQRALITTTEQVFEALNTAIDNCEEGIILKNPDSVYKPNSRKNDWIKLKPDYSEEGTVDLDLLIIGGYYGAGRMKGQVCHFLLGLAAEQSSCPEKFMSVARVSSGLSDLEIANINSKLNTHWKKFKANNPPPFLLLKKEKPDVYIIPSCSIILTVKSPEVMRSDAYYTGYTLRFVRVEAVRYDKLWSDCLWIGEFNKQRTSAAGKLTAGHIVPHARRKRKLEQNQGPSEPQVKVEKISSVFDGKEICVISGIEGHSKQDLENLILENGGSIVQYPGSLTFCIVYGTKNIRVQNLIKAKKHNITTYEWLLNCVSEGRVIPWDRLNLVSSDWKTEEIVSQQYDIFGDSYYEPTTPEKLALVFKSMPPVTECTPEEVNEVDRLLFNGVSPFSIFRGIYAYFDVGSPNLINIELTFKFLSGNVCSELNKIVNYVILDEDYLQNLNDLKEQSSRIQIECKFVTYKWIMDCFKNKTLEDDRTYLI